MPSHYGEKDMDNKAEKKMKMKEEKPKAKKGGSPWITFVKQYAKKNKMKYNEALKDPKIKSAYEKSKKGKK